MAMGSGVEGRPEPAEEAGRVLSHAEVDRAPTASSLTMPHPHPVASENMQQLAFVTEADAPSPAPPVGRSGSGSPGSSRMSSTTPTHVYPMETASQPETILATPEVLFGPIPTEELNQLTVEIGTREHQNYQQQQLFQRSFQRLVTELERVYKHQLFNLLLELGLTSLLFGGGAGMNGSKSLHCDAAARRKLVMLQQYTKKKCDALVAALKHHDHVFGTVLKNSLLPFLVTSKCFEDGVINMLCAFSNKQQEPPANGVVDALGTTFPLTRGFDQSGASTPGLASDWSLSGGSSPGCSSPTPREAQGLHPGLAGPPPPKRAKLSVNQSKAVEFLRTEGLVMQPAIKSEPDLHGLSAQSSAFRYLKGGQRSALFASKAKLPDNTPLGHASLGNQLHVQGYGMLSGGLHHQASLQQQLLHHPVSQLAQHQFQPVPNLQQYNSVMLPTRDAYDPMDPHVSRSSMSMSAELMAATTSLENQNAWNQQARSTGRKRKKRFKGIRKTASGKWVSRIEHNGKQKHLGTFATLEEAATTYDEALYQILSRIRTKKINLKRFNFPDKIRIQYGLGENGSFRVKKEMPAGAVPSQHATMTFKQERITHPVQLSAYSPSVPMSYGGNTTILPAATLHSAEASTLHHHQRLARITHGAVQFQPAVASPSL